MKKAKKRALLSSIAMLVVSAVVLSSATFAWFVAGTEASVNQFTASVDSGSSVRVSATNIAASAPGWKTTVNINDLSGWTYTNGQDLQAVSTGPNVSTTSFFTGELVDGTFNAAALDADHGTYAIQKTVYVKASEDIKLTGTTISVDGGLDKAVYVALVVDGTLQGIYNAAKTDGFAYNGIAQEITNATDDETPADIMSVDDTGIVAADLSAVTASGDIALVEIPFTANQVKSVQFFVWLEGQDETCVGSKSASVSMNLVFKAPDA